jgi:serine/threonine protein phosphatase 1
MDYAIGDIHGCLDKVLRLLEVIRYDPAADRLIFLGDYVDRGPDSKGVLDCLLRVQEDNPANIFLMGNHEENFLTYIHTCLTDEDTDSWRTEPFFAGGGTATLLSYHPRLRQPQDPRLVNAIPPAHITFLMQLPCYWTDDTYIAVHAGVRPGRPLEQQHQRSPTDSLPFLHTPHGLGNMLFGHTPFREVKYYADKVGLIQSLLCSSGYGKLTAFCLQTQQTFQVE